VTRRYITDEVASVIGLHGVWLAAGSAALLMVTIGAGAAVILVALVPRQYRVEAIRATAELLAALLPWPRRRSRR
jgi:hypothetical protein